MLLSLTCSSAFCCTADLFCDNFSSSFDFGVLDFPSSILIGRFLAAGNRTLSSLLSLIFTSLKLFNVAVVLRGECEVIMDVVGGSPFFRCRRFVVVGDAVDVVVAVLISFKTSLATLI